MILGELAQRVAGRPFAQLVQEQICQPLGIDDLTFGMRTSVFGHTGAGGSIAFADPDYHFSLALLKNQMSWRGPEDTDQTVMRVVRAALCIPG